MSVRVMSQVWLLKLPDSQKIVLLALADSANDEGHCWPSMRSLVEKTSKSERTVQGVIRELVDAGHVTRCEVPGKGCNYYVHPRSDCAPQELRPADVAPRKGRAGPPQPLRTTPAAAADKPSENRKEPSLEANASSARAPRQTKQPDPFPRPDWADEQVWKDFLANRKAKRLPNTATAYAKFLADIDKLTDAEWPPGLLLEHAVARGWGAIFDPRPKFRSGPNYDRAPTDNRDGFAEAIDDRLDQLRTGAAAGPH